MPRIRISGITIKVIKPPFASIWDTGQIPYQQSVHIVHPFLPFIQFVEGLAITCFAFSTCNLIVVLLVLLPAPNIFSRQTYVLQTWYVHFCFCCYRFIYNFSNTVLTFPTVLWSPAR